LLLAPSPPRRRPPRHPPPLLPHSMVVFFWIATATTGVYTLSLHDALPISETSAATTAPCRFPSNVCVKQRRENTIRQTIFPPARSEEHTSELQSRFDLVCRLLLEKKKKPAASAEPRGTLIPQRGATCWART